MSDYQSLEVIGGRKTSHLVVVNNLLISVTIKA